MRYIKALDGLRFLAVTLVLADHWSGHSLGFPAGYLGVCIFFVLSGFLITNILISYKQKDEALGNSPWKSWKVFFVRRSIRIFPLYYLVILIAFLLGEKSVKQFWFYSISYTNNFYIAFKQTWMGVIDHLWSLAVEEQFYLFFPFVVLFFSLKYLPKTIGFFILLSVALRAILYFSGADWMAAYVLMPTCLDAFGAGALLAYFFKNKQDFFKQIQEKSSFIFILGLVLYFGLTQFTAVHGALNTIFLRSAETLIAVGLILFSTDQTSRTSKIFELRPLVYIGKISYCIYLIHNFVYNEYHSASTHPLVIFFKNNPTFEEYKILKVSVLYFITIVLASISWYTFELPVNKLKSRFEH